MYTLQLSIACCFATLLAVLQLTGAVLLWREQSLTTGDVHAAAVGLVVFFTRAIGGGVAWSARRHETTVAQRQLHELTVFVRRSGLELPKHLERLQ